MPVSLTNINIGTSPGDGTGDPARTAFNTVNNNNDALEAAVLTQSEVDERVVEVAPDVALSALRTKTYVSGNVSDDGVFTVQLTGELTSGIMIISDNANASRGIFAIRARSGPHITAISSSGLSTSTNDLTVTPGADGAVTVSATADNKVQVNNRSGGTRFYSIMIGVGENVLP